MGNTPNVRFKGFTEDWEQRKLSDVAGVHDGVHQTPDYQDEGIMFLSVENIATMTSEKYISEEAYERDYKVRPEKGDILMTRIGDVGTPNVVETDEKLAYYVSLALLKPKGIDSYFLNNAIQSSAFQHGLRERTLLTAIPMKINKDEIGKVDISFPTDVNEQRKIGESFKQLDNLITLQQQKCDETKEFKKYMLQNMFPQKDEKVPKIRFDGFTGDWEQRKVGDYYEFKNGLNKGKEFFGMGTPIVNFTDVFHKRGLLVSDLQGKVTLEQKEIDNFLVKKGDIFFTRTSETVEEIGYPSVMLESPENTVFSGFVLRGRTFLEQDPLEDVFKKYVFFTDSFRKEMMSKSSMTTRALTSGTAIKNMVFYHPLSKEEQKKIGDYFSKLDNLITLHQQKCAALKEFKKYMLQNMFPQKGENKCQN